MLRFLLTILAVYLVLLLLQGTICRSVNSGIFHGYWWMVGDEAEGFVQRSTPQLNLPTGIAGVLSPTNLSQTIQNAQQTAQQVAQALQGVKYAPRPHGSGMAIDQAAYIAVHWCWHGIL